MTTLKRQIQLKLKKFDELMVELKIKYADDKSQKEFEDDLEWLHTKKDSVLNCYRFLFSSETVIPKNRAASFFDLVAESAYFNTASLVSSGRDFQIGKP